VSRALERFLDHADRPKQEGDRYFAFCPVHPDGQKHGRRSLSIKAGDDGRVLLHCFAGCPNREIVSAVGMQMYELYDDLVEDEGPRKREWPIRDSKGRTVAVHHRMDLPNGKKRVWWTRNGTKGLGGLRTANLPLYGSENVGDADTVVIVEGEKAADAFIGTGMVACATVTGAAGTPETSVLRFLAGKRVILWPDNDEEGRAHMRRVGDALAGIADEVRWFEWTEARPKGDAADWRGSANELLAALDQAPVWEPPQSIDSRHGRGLRVKVTGP